MRDRSRTRVVLRHVVAVVVLGFAGLAGFIASFAVWGRQELTCEADFSEATIPAPASYRGRLVCSVAESGDLGSRAPFLLMGACVVIGLVAAFLWFRTPRWRRLCVLAVVQLATPALVGLALLLVPADCTDAQREAYGAGGCERNEEERPGLSQWDR